MLDTYLREQQADIRRHFQLPAEERHRHRAPIDKSVLHERDVLAAVLSLSDRKCAYCESRLTGSPSEVSHYRPLSNARSNGPDRDSPDHYSWLAYEWRNLLPICFRCQESKGSLFPVRAARAAPLSSWMATQGIEDPLLLDPCADEPATHLTFDNDGYAVPRSVRGGVTIDILELNRPELVSRRAQAIAAFVRPLLDRHRPLTDHIAQALARDAEFAGVVRLFLREFLRIATTMAGSRRPRYDEKPEETIKRLSEQASVPWFKVFDECNRKNLEFLLNRSELNLQYPVKSRREHPSVIRVGITGFKGIGELALDLKPAQGSVRKIGSAMLLGENSTGKSTILQAIALVLMSRVERRGLRQLATDFVSREPTDWESMKQEAPTIELTFTNGASAKLVYDLVTNSFRVDKIPEIVVLGYGARRIFISDGKRRRRSRVLSLFNPAALISDNSKWLSTADDHHFNAVARAMADVLELGPEDEIYRDEGRRVLVKAHGKITPIEKMSDGYRSLFAMSLDIMCHMVEAWDNLEYARGVVLIDELEIHLHPRWKMRVMSALRDAMPFVQFIATTHDPLCLRGMQDGEVHVLYREVDGSIGSLEDLPNVSLMRAEQILTSEFFGLSSTSDPGQEAILERLSVLSTRSENDLDADERRERDRLLEEFGGLPYIGNSVDRQILAEAMTRHLRDMPAALPDRRRVRQDSVERIIAVLERARVR